jgi:hypothetical protein
MGAKGLPIRGDVPAAARMVAIAGALTPVWQPTVRFVTISPGIAGVLRWMIGRRSTRRPAA